MRGAKCGSRCRRRSRSLVSSLSKATCDSERTTARIEVAPLLRYRSKRQPGRSVRGNVAEVRLAGKAVGIYLAIILVLVAAGFLYQSVGTGGVIALAALLIAGLFVVLRSRRAL
jgi:positive regulator of sigma E activity